MQYSYKTDGEECEYDAESDREAIEVAKKEANLTNAQIADGAWLRVFAADGYLIYEDVA